MGAPPTGEFDEFAGDYQRYLNCGRDRHYSGETMEYFSRGRIARVVEHLRARRETPRRILDFGCGIGHAAFALGQEFPDSEVLGVDVSARSLEIAERAYASARVGFVRLSAFKPSGAFDLIHCNGVFHHVDPQQRPEVMGTVFEAARPGGYFSLWENNAWHPIVRYIMQHSEIDRNAVPVSPTTARALCRRAGFRIVDTSFWFVFPRWLGSLRFLERSLSPIPLGGQYHVLCQKP